MMETTYASSNMAVNDQMLRELDKNYEKNELVVHIELGIWEFTIRIAAKSSFTFCIISCCLH